jgi:hypothetical protein
MLIGAPSGITRSKTGCIAFTRCAILLNAVAATMVNR